MTLVSATTGATIVGYPVHFTIANKAAQNDLVKISDAAGIVPFCVQTIVDGAALSGGTPEYWEYASIQAVGAITATIKSISYDNGTANERNSGGYYLFAPATGEMLYVTADSGYSSTSGTLTVRRGMLSTTAADIDDNDYLKVMNCICLKSNVVGKVLIGYLTMPEDPKANFL